METFDAKKREQRDVLSIPSTFTIMQMEVLATKAERAKLKKSKLDTIQFDLKDPNIEGPVLYDQILPNLDSLRVRKEKTRLERRGLLDFSQVLALKMFHYFFYLESIIELELNIAKVGLTAKQVLELN